MKPKPFTPQPRRAWNMLWPCKAERRTAREIGVGELCSSLSDNLKRNI